MLFLSVESWTIGLIKSIDVIWGVLWGSFLIYQGKKSKVKLLIYWGIYTISVYLTSLGTAVDFLTILVTGSNVDGFVYILLTWIAGGINPCFLIIVLAELLAPKYKWYFISNCLIVLTFYHLSLYLNTSGSIYLEFPIIPGEEIISDTVNPGPFGYILSGALSQFIFLGGFGLIYKGIQSQGIIRKKYIYIAISILLLYLPAIFDVLINIPIPILAMVEIIELSSPWFSYMGLRKEPEIHKKKIKEEVKVKDSFFRITQRPDQISEEEVTYYREQKICLMCKGKVGGFNTYICTKCEALYHQNCARSLSDSENACWVCNHPIDETKPTKSFKIVEETKVGEIFPKEDKNSNVKEKKNQTNL